jgi:hypothetical protein
LWQVTRESGTLSAMRLALLMCAIALAGCSTKKPDCAGIAKHTTALYTADLDKRVAAAAADPKLAERLQLDRKMIPIGEAMTRDRCEKEKWGADKIGCVHRAKSMEEVDKCK